MKWCVPTLLITYSIGIHIQIQQKLHNIIIILFEGVIQQILSKFVKKPHIRRRINEPRMSNSVKIVVVNQRIQLFPFKKKGAGLFLLLLFDFYPLLDSEFSSFYFQERIQGISLFGKSDLEKMLAKGFHCIFGGFSSGT